MADAAPQQRDPDVVAYQAFTGLRNDVPPERFGPGDLDAAVNVDIDKSGGVSRRDGQIRVTATATHSVWADPEGVNALCVQGTQLMRINNDFSQTAIATGLTAGQHMSFCKVNDQIYHANGREKAVIDKGVLRSWGLPVPPQPSAFGTSGSTPPGDYQFVFTYVRADGQESGAGAAGRAAVGSISIASKTGARSVSPGGLVFSLPVPADPTITQINIYMSRASSDTLYLAATVAAGTASFAYTGDTSEFVYDLKTQFLSPPPVGHIVGYYSGRMYVGVGDLLFYSEPHAYELFNLRRFIPMNGRITMIAPLEDKERFAGSGGLNSGLFLGTDRNCGILVGNDPDRFQYVPKVDYGAIEGAVDYVDGSLYGDGATGARKLPMWLTTQGICVGMPEMEIRNLTRTRYQFSAAGSGAAVFQPGPNRFLAVSNF